MLYVFGSSADIELNSYDAVWCLAGSIHLDVLFRTCCTR
jgi:hypothetical protein